MIFCPKYHDWKKTLTHIEIPGFCITMREIYSILQAYNCTFSLRTQIVLMKLPCKSLLWYCLPSHLSVWEYWKSFMTQKVHIENTHHETILLSSTQRTQCVCDIATFLHKLCYSPAASVTSERTALNNNSATRFICCSWTWKYYLRLILFCSGLTEWWLQVRSQIICSWGLHYKLS